MGRYIDANGIRITAQTVNEGGEVLVSLADVRKAIEQTPTADVVEVVRCKDCEHATIYSCKNDACCRGIICEYRIGTDDENFFCSYGERKEQG